MKNYILINFILFVFDRHRINEKEEIIRTKGVLRYSLYFILIYFFFQFFILFKRFSSFFFFSLLFK